MCLHIPMLGIRVIHDAAIWCLVLIKIQQLVSKYGFIGLMLVVELSIS